MKDKILIALFLISPLLAHSQERIFGTLNPMDFTLQDSTPIPLQDIIDMASDGDTILLEPGYYTGPVFIKQNRIVLDGQNHAIVSGMGYESVLYIEGDSISIKNMVITDSGGSHDRIDCGVKITGSYNIVENCRIKECLFGIDIFKSDGNLIIHNEISSLARRSKALKGDAIRLWWAKRNTLHGNYWHNVRDMVIWYSEENLIEENKGVGNRYSIHFMYAHNNRIRANEFYNNSVGVFLMYSERTIMTYNLIVGSLGISGMCLGLKETSSNQILHNRFIYSAEGIHVDRSPYVFEEINTIANNEIAFCGSAFFFHTNQEGNLIKENYIHNNLSQVTIQGKTANGNRWINNYWDDYQGFDKDGDNVGDSPYRLYNYVEHIWDFNEDAKFFFGSPLLVVLDFLERLAPFSKPKFVLRDNSPVYIWEEKNIITEF